MSPAATLTPVREPSSPTVNDLSSAPLRPSNTLTIGPPPAPLPVTMSGVPSPFTSPTATFTPPVNVESYGMNVNNWDREEASNTATRGAAPGDEPTAMMP